MPATTRERIETVVASDAADLAGRVAERFLAAAGATAGTFSVVLSGGSTPRRLYERLATPPFRSAVRWDAIELFFGDERAVPPEHPDSNYRMVREALLSKVAVRAHRMRAETGEAQAYEQLLRERIDAQRGGVPILDLVLLGVGADGHTASLFPGTRALDERARLVVMNEVSQLHTRRMTVTYPLLNEARRVWVLAPGADKREIVSRCLAARDEPDVVHRLPVLGVRPRDGELVWWLDAASAGQ
jgi:6-phosphogluconolactonase